MNLSKKIDRIVAQGNTSNEYRELLATIFRAHRNHFTEENWATAVAGFREFVEEAIAMIDREERGEKRPL
jgi:hemerythrin